MAAAVRSPLAPGAAIEVIARLDVPALRRKWRKQFGIEIGDDFPAEGEILLYRCTASDLRFFHPASLEGKASLYEELERVDWYYSEDRWDFRRALRDLAACADVLEVGCGTGRFLAMLAARHPGVRASGVELNANAAAQAARRGFAVHRKPLADIARELPARFDAVCAFQVLEHVADIAGFVHSCIALLKPGGKLVFSVPNSRSYLEHYDDILDSPPHHMSRWSVRSFRFLASRFMLRLEAVAYQPLSRGEMGKYCAAKQVSWSHGLLGNRSVSELARTALFMALRTGLHRFFRGHSIYVVLRSDGLPPAA